MVYFKVSKGACREIAQCEPKPDRVRDIAPNPAPEPEPAPVEDSEMRLEIKEFLTLLHKKTVPWAEGEIKKLQTAEEVDAALEVEYVHPRFHGGRVSIIDALQERRGEIEGPPEPSKGPGDLQAAPPVHTAAAGLPCPEPDCGFSAGSQEGLEAHIKTHHATVDKDL